MYAKTNSDMAKQPKSVLLDEIRLLILMDGRPDYKIAHSCGVSPSTILNVRTGKHCPNVLYAEMIYNTLSGRSLEDVEL